MNKNFFTGLDPEDAFLDSSNIPGFNTTASEGKIVKALTNKEIYLVGLLFTLVILIFLYKLFSLQILNYDTYNKLSKDNILYKKILFAERGVITDRFGKELVWNEPQTNEDLTDPRNTYSLRKYTPTPGLYNLLGYVSYPDADKQGHWWRSEFIVNGGVEQSFNTILKGKNGNRLIEKDATQKIISTGSVEPAIDGETLQLSIDANLTRHLYKAIKDGATISRFIGGAGVIMDINTGEILAITTFPEYNSNILTDGTNKTAIANYSTNKGKPFLNRAVQGSYTPGSIIKPYIGLAALEEGIITENTKILSTGVLKVPNPYHPGKFSTFHDWRKGLGWLDIKEAIKMSSSIFFYVVGGGFESQPGLGIQKIDKWAKVFGFGTKTNISLPGEREGLIPTPEWKEATFGKNEKWNLGNTYHSSIGQYGWLVTPIQAVRYIASVANEGILYKPILRKGVPPVGSKIKIKPKNFKIIQEGMRRGAKAGTARALNLQKIHIAAKTGTAQLGKHNEYMNSWVVGFWPYENPKFAFAVVLERAKANTLRGAAPAMRPFFEWLGREHQDDYAIGIYPKINDTK